jgi:hypothetical protein
VEVDLTTPSANNFNDWCSATGFADNVINDCEFCYNLTYRQVNPQVYMANCKYAAFVPLAEQQKLTTSNDQSSNPSGIIAITKPL